MSSAATFSASPLRADRMTIGALMCVAHPAADLGAFQIRQAEVEHDQVGRAVGDRLHRLDAGADHVHV